LRANQREHFTSAAGVFLFGNYLENREVLGNSEPIRYENVTLRDVLREHMKAVPAGIPTSFDEKEFRLKIGRPEGEELSWRRFLRWIGL